MDERILKALRSVFLERTSLETLPDGIWKRSAALNTWGTNAIEGSTITRKDAERILLEGISVSGKPIRDVLETIQHEGAFRGLLGRRTREIALKTILTLHEEVFRGILLDAGQWRRVNIRIQGAAFTPPRMERVLVKMEKWANTYRQRDIEGEDTFTLAAWMHYRFERIHPFSDGNGRVGRLLLNLHFMKRNWPPVHILPPHRDTYIHGLYAAADGDLTLLTELLKIVMGASLIDLLDQVGTEADALLSVKDLSRSVDVPYSPKYLALRCHQGKLPAVKSGREWQTSKRALALYLKACGRK
jgi:Fic family protein